MRLRTVNAVQEGEFFYRNLLLLMIDPGHAALK
jgi:hypothetical protein